jgi:hypothetical protein
LGEGEAVGAAEGGRGGASDIDLETSGRCGKAAALRCRIAMGGRRHIGFRGGSTKGNTRAEL